jgi:hypothetical protein
MRVEERQLVAVVRLHEHLSSGGEYSSIMGIENSLAGIPA